MPPADAAHTPYLLRMQRVARYIDRHLDGDLALDVLSGLPPFRRTIFTGNSARHSVCRSIAMCRWRA